jgi:hypothetical protein
MVVSECLLKWAIRFYPPLLLQRIWVVKFEKGFLGVQVKIFKSLLNKNYNNSIFGGTLFSAADPFYPLLFHRVLTGKGYDLRIWSKSAEIKFIKPGTTNLSFKIAITYSDIANCEDLLNTVGKYEKAYPIYIYDKNNDLCVTVTIEVYMRNLSFIEPA